MYVLSLVYVMVLRLDDQLEGKKDSSTAPRWVL